MVIPTHIDNSISSATIIQSYDCILSVIKPSEGVNVNTAMRYDYVAANGASAIGLLQGQEFVQSRAIAQVGEIGSLSLFQIISTPQRSMNLSRLLCSDKSLMKAVLSEVLNVNTDGGYEVNQKIIKGSLWIDINYPHMHIPVHLRMKLLQPGTGVEVCTLDFINVLFANLGMALPQGTKTVIENASMSWERINPL